MVEACPRVGSLWCCTKGGIMKRLAISVVLAMVCLSAFAAFATFVAKDAIAQVVRAAAVKVVDEPGRNPYQAFRPFSVSTPSTDGSYFCQQPPSPPVCFLLLPDVPAGKRLVVENVTGKVSVLAPGFPSAVNLQTSGSLGFANLVAIPMELLPGVTGN